MNKRFNFLLISIAILLTITLISVRLIFLKKFESFSNELKSYETTLKEDFDRKKEQRLASLETTENRSISQLFKMQFKTNKAIVKKDTSFTFLYLNKKTKYITYSPVYFDCLQDKCIRDLKNLKTETKIYSLENKLQQKYGSDFTQWYVKYKNQIIVNKKVINKCNNLLVDQFEISFNKEVWEDFEKFLKFYIADLAETKKNNQISERNYDYKISSTKRQLNQNGLKYLESRLSEGKNNVLSKKIDNRTYISSFLGKIDYRVEVIEFDQQHFKNMVAVAYKEHWKNNSLRTGAMPYSNCYGSSNYCNDWGCSQIKVIAGGLGDVLVTIKNNSRNVVRHAYIRGGNSYTFNIRNGNYQVFFYSGKGWNPNKFIPSISCNSLKGGFVSNESVTKDKYIYLSNQVMTYELILQERGNFSTKPSSKNEAF